MMPVSDEKQENITVNFTLENQKLVQNDNFNIIFDQKIDFDGAIVINDVISEIDE